MPIRTRPPDPPTELTSAGMADACDVSIDALRNHEREGLLDPVARTDRNRRRSSSDDVTWIQVLRCLRVTAMLLEAHRAEVVRRCEDLDAAFTTIDHEIAVYREVAR